MSLYIVPDEILLIIFNYCEVHDLIRLNGVCKRFYWITSELLNKKSNDLLVTSEMSEKFRRRCQPLLSSKSKFSTYYNWKHGRFESKILYSKFVHDTDYWRRFFEGLFCKNRLRMTKDMILFVSDKINLYAFNRTKNGSVSGDNWITEKCTSEIELLNILPCNDIIVTTHRDGSMRQWTIESLDGRKYFNEKLLPSHLSDIFGSYYVMDSTSQYIITGSNAEEIEIWKYISQENSIVDMYMIPDLNVDAFVKLITFDPTGTKFAAWFDTHYIIYDINKCYTEKRMDWLDWNPCTGSDDSLHNQVLWEDPNTILFLNMYTIIKIDVRTHKAVQKWHVPPKSNYIFPQEISPSYMPFHFDETFTCMSSDNQYAIITGTACGKLILWDQRQNASIQTYGINSFGTNYVGCLQFDSSHMYVAADQLYEFDFLHK